MIKFQTLVVLLMLLVATAASAAGVYTPGMPAAGDYPSTLPLTGIERIPADTGLPQGLDPQSEAITPSQLLQYSTTVSPGAIPHVASLAALRALAPGAYAVVVRDNFAAGTLAPPLWFAWAAACPSTPDNVALYVAPNVGGPGCWSAAADPNVNNALEWGSDPTAVNSSQTALQAFASFVCSAQNRKGYIPAGSYLYTGITLNLAAGVKCTIEGDGPLQTTLYQTGTTGDDWHVTGSGSQQFILSHMALKEASTGLKVSGYAVYLGALYFPELDDLTITGWNGVESFANATPKIDVNFGQMNGTEGIYSTGDVSQQGFGGEIRANGSVTDNTNLVWLDMDSWSNSLVVERATFQFGGKCVQMRDSAGLGLGNSAPQWLNLMHIECDHANANTIDLVAGSMFWLQPGSVIISTVAGDAVVQESTFGGGATFQGAQIAANFGRAFNILGGVDTKILDNDITANGQGSGSHWDEISVATGMSKYQISRNYISPIGTTSSSTDLWCINTNASSGSNIDISYNKAMGCGSGSVSATPTGANVTAIGNDAYFSKLSWTPTDGSGASLAFTGVNASYSVDGSNYLRVSFALTYPTTASGSAASIVGLPFAVPAQTYAQATAPCTTSNGTNVVAVAETNSYQVAFIAPATQAAIVNSTLSTQTIRCTLTYPRS